MGQQCMVVFKLNAELRVGQQLDNGTLEFQQIFLGHLSFLSNPPSRFIAPARFVALAIPVPGFPLRFPAFAGRARGSYRKALARTNTPENRPFQGGSEEHTSDIQSLMRTSYAASFMKKTKRSRMIMHHTKKKT